MLRMITPYQTAADRHVPEMSARDSRQLIPQQRHIGFSFDRDKSPTAPEVSEVPTETNGSEAF
jgi:hypothetical protein